jgi:pyridoxal phosphate enzyme (YggS family)
MSTMARFKTLRAAVEAATADAGRPKESVTLIAVSKGFRAEDVKQVSQTGHSHFGESYVMELKEKSALGPTLEWHFIGRVQTNKAGIIARCAGLVHTIVSERHALAIAKRRDTPLRCLIQVNIAQEPQKGGVAPDEALALATQLHAHENILVEGLMCIPPATANSEKSRPHFQALATLAEQGRAQGLPLHQLSMGMSGDFDVAIQEGATLVRVGSAIFGERSLAGTPNT